MARNGIDGSEQLDQIINALPADRRGPVLTALTPPADHAPTDDAAWLARAEAAVGAIVPAVARLLTKRLRALVCAFRWRELVEAVARDWPDRPEPLGQADVIGRLEALAGQVAGRSPPVRRQVIDDAPGVIFRAFPRYNRTRRFNPWARRVLHNHAVSLFRRERRITSSSELLAGLAGCPAPAAGEVLAHLLHDFRRLCDAARFPRPTRTGPELAAVFALEARLRLLDELVPQPFLDQHLPLRSREKSLILRGGWPRLGDLWVALAVSPHAGAGRHAAIAGACRRLSPEAAVGGLDGLWNTWLHRAKKSAAREIACESQARLFFYLFPANRRARSGVGRDDRREHGRAS